MAVRCPEPAADFEAVEARHHDIENHQARGLVSCCLQRLCPRLGHPDLVSLVSKAAAKQARHGRVVVHDENLLCAHGINIRAAD